MKHPSDLLESNITPPALALRILNLSVPVAAREHLIGDLIEEYVTDRLPEQGRARADLWFWKQTILSCYEFLNKQQGGIMAFIISMLIFIAVGIMAMVLSGEVGMFVNLPSLIVVVPPAIAFGLAVTSFESMKLSIKLCISEQSEIPRKNILLAVKFANVTGNTAVYMGVIFTLVGAIAIASNINTETFSKVFGPAFAVCVLTAFYAAILKTICYVAEQKIENQYLLDTDK